MDVNCTDIQFLNVKDNEVFSFSLILIKGYIEQSSSDLPHSLIVYNVNSGQRQQITKTRIQDNRFIILLQLQCGRNEFIFDTEQSQCSCTKTFSYIPAVTNKVVIPVFVLCRNANEPNLDLLCRRISFGCQVIQTLIAETLYQCGFGRKTFNLPDGGETNENTCVVFDSSLNPKIVASMTNEGLWKHLGREIMMSEYGCNDRKFLAFLTKSKQKYSENLAIGGGGLALCDSKYLGMLPDSINDINETCQNASWMQHNFGTALGAVCHELCHTFDLGHTVQGIMGKDFHTVGSLFIIQRPFHRINKVSRGNFSCSSKLSDSLVINDGSLCHKLSMHYSIAQNNSPTDIRLKKEKNLNELLPETTFWFEGCATLLAYHKWINNYSSSDTDDESILHYDPMRSIATSKRGIVVVQLCKADGYIFKYWEFSCTKKKNLFLVPVCEVRRASCIVIEDLQGNLLKKDILN